MFLFYLPMALLLLDASHRFAHIAYSTKAHIRLPVAKDSIVDYDCRLSSGQLQRGADAVMGFMYKMII